MTILCAIIVITCCSVTVAVAVFLFLGWLAACCEPDEKEEL